VSTSEAVAAGAGNIAARSGTVAGTGIAGSGAGVMLPSAVGWTALGLAGLIQAARGLGAERVAGLSAAERILARELTDRDGTGPGPGLAGLPERIAAGEDPLGDALCMIRGAAERRQLGQTLTPAPIVASMTAWAAAAAGPGGPARVVDPGTGTGRFLLAAGRRWPGAELVGAETDPAAAMIARANLAAAGLAGRARVVLADYRTLTLPPVAGPTLYLGNPPYVRHHLLDADGKRWLTTAAAESGLAASTLSGLHVHFFLATARQAAPGDLGVFITAAEWLDVNYGALVRELLLGDLGGEAVHLLEPRVPAFADAIVTSAITCFRPGRRPGTVRLRLAGDPAELGDLSGGHPVPRARLAQADRWGALVRDPAGQRQAPVTGQVELGEICRVHRGQVTGANAVWVTVPGTALPPRFLVPTVTRARELFAAPDGTLPPGTPLRLVADLPASLDDLDDTERELVGAFIARAARAGAAGSYIARHRRPWWRVGLTAPAPILASYMARRPPTFVRNLAGARHLNIAHGLYPREPLPGPVLDRLARYLRRSADPGQGRTYAGGLTKFEPREMERLLVPWPEIRG